MTTRSVLGMACVVAMFVSSVALAQGARVSSAVELARQADLLKPGQWVWAPRIAPSGPVLVYVDLSRQLATVYRNGVRIGVSTVSTGKPGHDTPTGVFTILEKNVKHRSSTYNNASMPYQQRLTWDGVALHAGGLPGYPESHGCVHLPMAFARELFATTQQGTTVVIANGDGHAGTSRGGQVLAPAAGEGGATDFWAPERSATGPVTIVMSRGDQAVAVLRNGIEIGRSPATIPASDDATHVLTLTRDHAGADAWTYVGVAGHDGEEGAVVDEAVRNRVQVPAAFYARVRPLLQPGTTLLVTQAALGSGNAGSRLTVITSGNERAGTSRTAQKLVVPPHGN